MNTLEGQQASKKITEKRLKWHGRPCDKKVVCDEDERGAHGGKNARGGHSREKKKRVNKPKLERCVQERYDRGGAERGQHNKQGTEGSMEPGTNITPTYPFGVG